jgi:UDP-N-acetylglucosamine 2-epimerase (non-hydrolysing)
MLKIVAAFGTRAEAIKFAPLLREIRARSDRLALSVVVTGEHARPLEQVLQLFEIEPDIRLESIPASVRPDRNALFARVFEGLAGAVARLEPDLVVVLGDTVTTLAGTLAAYYRRIRTAHVEAGLRSVDKFGTFPEDGHRKMVSSIADLHFSPTERARLNLLNEGIPGERVIVTGNTSIDALRWVRDRIEEMRTSGTLRLPQIFEHADAPATLLKQLRYVEREERRLILFAGSRPENFGSRLQTVCGALSRLSDEYPDDLFVYPVDLQPPLRDRVHALLDDIENIYLLPPLDYLPFIYLMQLSHHIITDSGSIQEEATSLNKPVLVMRDLTDRPEGLEAGAAKLVGSDAISIVSAARRLLNDEAAYQAMSHAPNPFGDGHAAERIADALESLGA